MNLRIRKIKNRSGSTSIQVVSRPNRKIKIEKHFGTAKTKDELAELLRQAGMFINDQTNTQQLPFNAVTDEHFDKLTLKNVFHNYAYEFLSKCYSKLNFDHINSQLLKDLAIIRIIEPSSKIRAIELLDEYFGIKYTKNRLYKELPGLINLKELCEETAINFSKTSFSFDFNLVFYDVTTLYFESFKEDNIKKCGFSKDNKFNQPQIVLALMVTQQGFPIGYEIFEGNKFEGHTIIPVIKDYKKKYFIEKLTVIADAAMLSQSNLKELRDNNIDYLVGARIGNLPLSLITEISSDLARIDKKIFSRKLDHYHLICDFSQKRAYKDKSDREKQLFRAEQILKNPKQALKKSKFIKTISKNKLELNKDLIEKAVLLEGIKGYATNILEITPELLISRYKDLWNIEKAFRVAKHDLEIRPIYLWTEVGIKSHIVIVFVSLCISKFLEIKTGLSIDVIRRMLWKVFDAELLDEVSRKTRIKRTPVPESIKCLENHL